MTVHHARVPALAAVLIGISALIPSTRLQAQQPLDELRALAEQGDADAQNRLASGYALSDGVPQDHGDSVVSRGRLREHLELRCTKNIRAGYG